MEQVTADENIIKYPIKIQLSKQKMPPPPAKDSGPINHQSSSSYTVKSSAELPPS